MICKRSEIPALNFCKCFKEEEPNQGLYRDLYKIDEKEFNNWFSKNAVVCEMKNSKEIEPPKHVMLELSQEKIYNPETGQCHYNSQMACLLYDELEFYTGLLLRDTEEDPITHSFCMLNNKIVDFTAEFMLNSDNDGLNLNYFPYKYIGVNIEKSFLFSKKQEIIENGYATNPYLYEWYLKTCKNC